MEIPEIFNAADHFVDRHMREGRGANIAIEMDDFTLTYEKFQEQVNRAGNGLKKIGVRKGDTILLLLLDTPEFPISFFAAIKIGAIPVPVNTLLMPSDYAYILNDSKAMIAIASEELLPKLMAVPWEHLQSIKTIVVGNGAGREASFFEMTSKASPHLKVEETHKDDPAFWLYSSGSTGFPKGCVHRQRDMAVCAEAYAKGVLGMTEKDRCFSASKLFFSYGLGNSLYFPFHVGAASILVSEPPKPERMIEVIEKHRATFFFAVPSLYAAIIHYQEKFPEKKIHFPSLRYGISSGEPLPAPMLARFKEQCGIELLDVLGSTEGLTFICNHPGAIRPGSSGQIIPGYEVKITDDQGKLVKRAEVGNLWIKGDSICAYYANRPEKTQETIHDGWLQTGDKYREDDDGYFWYVGRIDDMFKASGAWVSPVAVEAALMEHPSVREVGVVGREDGDQLMKPMAYVVLEEGKEGTEELARELQEFVKDHLPVYERPRWVEFVAELPRTTTGKLQRFKLRQKPVEKKAPEQAVPPATSPPPALQSESAQ